MGVSRVGDDASWVIIVPKVAEHPAEHVCVHEDTQEGAQPGADNVIRFVLTQLCPEDAGIPVEFGRDELGEDAPDDGISDMCNLSVNLEMIPPHRDDPS